jgi:hypothetical protein
MGEEECREQMTQRYNHNHLHAVYMQAQKQVKVGADVRARRGISKIMLSSDTPGIKKLQAHCGVIHAHDRSCIF